MTLPRAGELLEPGPVGRRRGRPHAGRPAPPAGPAGRAGHQVQPDRRGHRDGPGRRGADPERIRAAAARATRSSARRAGSPGSGRVRWIVDPLDGTVNYLYGLPDWAVSIARRGARARSWPGWWTCPGGARCSSPCSARGAWLRRAGGGAAGPAAVQRRGAARRRRWSAPGSGTRRAGGWSRARWWPPCCRRSGTSAGAAAAAVDLCSVAAGRVDAYFERGVNHWDFAAGGLIAAEAGAQVLGLDGKPAGPAMTMAAGPGAVRRTARPAGQPPPGTRRPLTASRNPESVVRPGSGPRSWPCSTRRGT